MYARLLDEIEVVGKRLRVATQMTILAIAWLLLFFIGWGLSQGNPLFGLTPIQLASVFFALAVAGSFLFLILSRNWFANPRWVASRIESRYPELESRLLTSLEQMRCSEERRIGFLQQLLLTQTINHSVRNHWDQVVPGSKLLFSKLAALLAFGLVVVATFMLLEVKPVSDPPSAVIAELQEQSQTPSNELVELESIDPGNVEWEKGTNLVVMARFKGALPPDCTLVAEFAETNGDTATPGLLRMPMNASLDDPVFIGQVPELTRPLTYWIEYNGVASDRFYVTLFEYPELQQLDIKLNYPKFTGLPDREINDVRRISAVKGTNVTLTATLNKSVEKCKLVDEFGEINLQEELVGSGVYVATMPIEQTRRLTLNLTDSDGRANRLPPEVILNAISNRPPEIKVTAPGRDTEVSPVEEMLTSAKSSDDYGVHRAGISFSVAAGEAQSVTLSNDGAPTKDLDVSYLLELESLGAKPKQLVSYYFWAEDQVADSKIRRVTSDIYFAEVREFEQIFKPGQQQSQQQQQQQQQQQGNQQAAQLRQLQKQIIVATWNLIRRELDEKPGPAYAADVSAIQESQQSALEMVEAIAEQMKSEPAVQAIATQIKTEMNKVILTLQDAIDQDSIEPLRQAPAQEQIVYQLILNLPEGEQQVQQQSSPGPPSSQQNRSQQQLQQLELENDRNRYEDENEAGQQQQSEESKKVQDALNRLKELARRQEDINEQLKQLQTALESAKDEQEKDEIERRLKRLREQQEELLRDLDALKEKTDQEQQNPLMQKASEDLEKARENVRKSAEAIEQKQVSKANAAGNRAKEQFDDLKEEFKKQNANRFSEQMTQMSREAQELEGNQKDLMQRLKEIEEASARSLRNKTGRDEVVRDLKDQKQKYEKILDDIKEVVRDAEETEPLLSRELYDAYRDAGRRQTGDSLQTTENLLSRGFVEESRKAAEPATEGISELNRRVQKAASSIIGDDAESLRRAEQTLRKLSKQIQGEIRDNQPAEPQQGDNSEGQPGSSQPGANAEAGDTKRGSGENREPQDQKGGAQAGPQEKSKNDNSKNGNSKSENPGKGTSKESKSGEPGSKGSEPSESSDSSKSGGQPKSDAKSGESESKSNSKSSSKSGSKGSGGGKGSDGGNESSPGSETGGDSNSEGNQSPSGQRSSSPNSQSSARSNSSRSLGGRGGSIGDYEQMFGPSTGGEEARPLTGTDYRQFSNDLRDLEELLQDPKLRAQASTIREKAKEMRGEMKRHSRTPNWDIVQDTIAEPLEELREEVARQLILKENKDALVPIDRDPVPAIFEDQVREYYKELSDIEKR